MSLKKTGVILSEAKNLINKKGNKLYMEKLKNSDTHHLNYFYYGVPFTGSLGGLYGMQYKISRDPMVNIFYDAKERENPDACLLGEVWRGPLAHDNVDPEEITSKKFEFTDEGKEELVNWLNEIYEKEYKR